MTLDVPPSSRWADLRAVAGILLLLTVYGVLSGAPFVIAQVWGLGWGVLAGIALPIAWLCTMPNSCFNGGLIWSMLGMWQLLLLCLWVVRGVVLTVRTLMA